jgi:hypothetical protein
MPVCRVSLEDVLDKYPEEFGAALDAFRAAKNKHRGAPLEEVGFGIWWGEEAASGNVTFATAVAWWPKDANPHSATVGMKTSLKANFKEVPPEVYAHQKGG